MANYEAEWRRLTELIEQDRKQRVGVGWGSGEGPGLGVRRVCGVGVGGGRGRREEACTGDGSGQSAGAASPSLNCHNGQVYSLLPACCLPFALLRRRSSGSGSWSSVRSRCLHCSSRSSPSRGAGPNGGWRWLLTTARFGSKCWPFFGSFRVARRPMHSVNFCGVQQAQAFGGTAEIAACALCRSSVRSAAQKGGDLAQAAQQAPPPPPAERVKQYQQAFERIQAATGMLLAAAPTAAAFVA